MFIYIYTHTYIDTYINMYAYFICFDKMTDANRKPAARLLQFQLLDTVPELTETHGRHSRVMRSRHLLAESDGAAILLAGNSAIFTGFLK